MSDAEAVFRWYLVLSACAVVAAPLIWWLGAGLDVSRQALLRTLAPIVVAFMIWWPAALTGLPIVTRWWLAGAALLLGIAGWTWLLARRRELRPSWTALLIFEAIWLVAFLGYLWFRSYYPDIANTEKPMEIALLSSVTRSPDAPAPDPWLAGEPINYYYFGYQLIGSLAKLSGVPPVIAFNLALGTLFASLTTVVAGIGYAAAQAASLRRVTSCAIAVLAAFFVVFAGNLETFKRLVRDPGATLEAGWWPGVGWNASRIISDVGVRGDPNPRDTINEFPAFSFVLGDLHPHVLAYPLLAAVLAVAVGFLLRPTTITAARLAVAGGLAGLLYATNSWDAPLALGLLFGAAAYSLRGRIRAHWRTFAAGLAGAIVTAAPFALRFTAPVGVTSGDVPTWIERLPLVGTFFNTVAVITWRPSNAGELLTVHGAWIALFAIFATWALLGERATLAWLRVRQEAVLVAGLLILAVSVVWAPGLLWLGLPAALAAILYWRDARPAVRVASALYAVGFWLALIPEFIYLQDSFGDRMNTVFKLYFQAWLLLALAGAVGIAAMLSSARRAWALAGVVSAVLAVVVTAGYTPISVVRWSELGGARGLDGSAYLARYSPGDAAVVDWINAHAEDGDVLVEAPGCGYGTYGGIPMNRVSAFTGVSAVLGWRNHEGQWRRGVAGIDGLLDSREAAANDWLDGRPPVDDDGPAPRFIVVGNQELDGSETCELVRERSTDVFARLEASGWRVAFEASDVRVYVPVGDPSLSVGLQEV